MDLENQIWIYVFSELRKHRMIPADLEQEGFWDRYADENSSIGKNGSELLHFYERRMKMSLHRSSIDRDSMMYLYKQLHFPISEELKLLLEKRFDVHLILSAKGILMGFKASDGNRAKTTEIDERGPNTSDHVRESSQRVTGNYGIPCTNRVQHNSTKVSTWEPRSPTSSVQDSRQLSSDESVGDSHPRENRKRKTKTNGRKFFTEREDVVLWNYVLEQYKSNELAQPRGMAMWKAYVKNKKSARTPESLASHFRKQMIPKLLYTELSLQKKMELYKKVKIFIDQEEKMRIEDYLGVSLELKDGYLQEYSKQVLSEEQSIEAEDNTPEEQNTDPTLSANVHAQPQDVEVQERAPEDREITTKEVEVVKTLSDASDSDSVPEGFVIEESNSGFYYRYLSEENSFGGSSSREESSDLDDVGTEEISGKRKKTSSVNESEINPTTPGTNS